MKTMPAHKDSEEGLKLLKDAGFRMVTLTNSSPSAVKAQLQNAGLTQYFDESISVDSVRRFKPDLETYRSAAAHLGGDPRSHGQTPARLARPRPDRDLGDPRPPRRGRL